MTALLPPSDRSLDVLCVGNAIVDVLAQTDDSFLEDHGMVKGSSAKSPTTTWVRFSPTTFAQLGLRSMASLLSVRQRQPELPVA